MSNMNQETLLIELGTEELPPKSLKKLGESFSQSIYASLKEAPRRLAVSITHVASKQPDQEVERKGPAIKAAFKEDGEATPAALGFARSCGTEIEKLDRLKTDKGEWLYYKKLEAGKSADELVQEAIETANKQLPIAKRMRWGDSDAEFVRPVQWLIALHGERIVPVSIYQKGIASIAKA